MTASHHLMALGPALVCLVAIYTAALLPTALTTLGQSQSDASGEQTASAVSGRCLCGAVRYRVDGEILEQSTCRCRSCQRAAGAVSVPWVRVPTDALVFTQGHAVDAPADAQPDLCGERGVFRVCADCGSLVGWRSHDGEVIEVTAGTLDDPSVFREEGEGAVTDALRREFGEAFRMFADAVRRLDDQAWRQGEPSWTEVPARTAMHILLTAEYYVAEDRESYDWEPDRWQYWDSPVEKLPDRAATLNDIERVAKRVDAYLTWQGDAGLRLGTVETKSAVRPRVAWMIYALRHLQHHVAQLSAQCKARGFGAAPWDGTAEDRED
ncbi:MAG: GFA family protein [Planctomycetota bacterium]